MEGERRVLWTMATILGGALLLLLVFHFIPNDSQTPGMRTSHNLAVLLVAISVFSLVLGILRHYFRQVSYDLALLRHLNESMARLNANLNPDFRCAELLSIFMDLYNGRSGVLLVTDRFLRAVVSSDTYTNQKRVREDAVGGAQRYRYRTFSPTTIPADWEARMKELVAEHNLSRYESVVVVPVADETTTHAIVIIGAGPVGRSQTEWLREVTGILVKHAVAFLQNAILHEEARVASITDPLTQLYNRRHFQNRLAAQFAFVRVLRRECQALALFAAGHEGEAQPLEAADVAQQLHVGGREERAELELPFPLGEDGAVEHVAVGGDGGERELLGRGVEQAEVVPARGAGGPGLGRGRAEGLPATARDNLHQGAPRLGAEGVGALVAVVVAREHEVHPMPEQEGNDGAAKPVVAPVPPGAVERVVGDHDLPSSAALLERLAEPAHLHALGVERRAHSQAEEFDIAEASRVPRLVGRQAELSAVDRECPAVVVPINREERAEGQQLAGRVEEVLAPARSLVALRHEVARVHHEGGLVRRKGLRDAGVDLGVAARVAVRREA